MLQNCKPFNISPSQLSLAATDKQKQDAGSQEEKRGWYRPGDVPSVRHGEVEGKTILVLTPLYSLLYPAGGEGVFSVPEGVHLEEEMGEELGGGDHLQ